MLISQDDRLFELEVARVPPHQIVNDRYPDLLVGRVVESTIRASLNPVVVAELRAPERDGATSPEVAKKMMKNVEWCDVYLSVVLDTKKTPDEHRSRVREALRAVVESTSKLRRWEVNFYNASAADKDVRYRPVVTRGLMQQVTEHRPHAEQIDHRWTGRGDADDDPLGNMTRMNLIADRAANDRSQRLIREEMKKIEQGETGQTDGP